MEDNVRFKRVDEFEHRGYFVDIGACFISNGHDISTGIFNSREVDAVYFKVIVMNSLYHKELESEGGKCYPYEREDLIAYPQTIVVKEGFFKDVTKDISLQESYEERMVYIKGRYKKVIDDRIAEAERKIRNKEITDGLPDSLKLL